MDEQLEPMGLRSWPGTESTMSKPTLILVAGLLLGACYSVSDSDINVSTRAQCRALPAVDSTNELEVVQACKAWIKTEPGNGDPYYYYGRTMLDAGATDRAMELFEEGYKKGSRLAENAFWFAREGSLH